MGGKKKKMKAAVGTALLAAYACTNFGARRAVVAKARPAHQRAAARWICLQNCKAHGGNGDAWQLRIVLLHGIV